MRSAHLLPPTRSAIPRETVLALEIDGVELMWIVLWLTEDPIDELVDAVDQVQDLIMESETEIWPECPFHRHPLIPEADTDWVSWVCPETDERIARLGDLPELDQP
jgi:hypothetical protein